MAKRSQNKVCHIQYSLRMERAFARNTHVKVTPNVLMAATKITNWHQLESVSGTIRKF